MATEKVIIYPYKLFPFVLNQTETYNVDNIAYTDNLRSNPKNIEKIDNNSNSMDDFLKGSSTSTAVYVDMYGIKQSESNEDLFDLCMVTYSDDITNPDFFVKLDDVFDSLMGDTEGSFKILGKEYYIPFYSRIKRIFIITKTTSRERVSGRLYGSSVKDQSEYQCFSMTFEKKDINDINDNYLYFEDFDKKKDFQELYETKAEKKFLFKKTDGWYIIIQLKYVDKTQDNTSIKRYFPMNKFETSFLPTISVFDATNKYLNKNVNTSLGKMKEGLSRKIGKQIGNQIASIKDTNIFNVDEPKAQKLPEGDFVNNVNSQLESLGNSIKTR